MHIFTRTIHTLPAAFGIPPLRLCALRYYRQMRIINGRGGELLTESLERVRDRKERERSYASSKKIDSPRERAARVARGRLLFLYNFAYPKISRRIFVRGDISAKVGRRYKEVSLQAREEREKWERKNWEKKLP